MNRPQTLTFLTLCAENSRRLLLFELWEEKRADDRDGVMIFFRLFFDKRLDRWVLLVRCCRGVSAGMYPDVLGGKGDSRPSMCRSAVSWTVAR